MLRKRPVGLIGHLANRWNEIFNFCYVTSKSGLFVFFLQGSSRNPLELNTLKTTSIFWTFNSRIKTWRLWIVWTLTLTFAGIQQEWSDHGLKPNSITAKFKLDSQATAGGTPTSRWGHPVSEIQLSPRCSFQKFLRGILMTARAGFWLDELTRKLVACQFSKGLVAPSGLKLCESLRCKSTFTVM